MCAVSVPLVAALAVAAAAAVAVAVAVAVAGVAGDTAIVDRTRHKDPAHSDHHAGTKTRHRGNGRLMERVFSSSKIDDHDEEEAADDAGDDDDERKNKESSET